MTHVHVLKGIAEIFQDKKNQVALILKYFSLYTLYFNDT